MPLLPYPDELPQAYRAFARRLLPSSVLRSGARLMQALAQHQSLLSAEYRANQRALRQFENRHRGETCVILGNGPSLASTDVALLGGVATFGLNRGYLWWEKRGYEPTYFVSVNELVIEQFAEELKRIGCIRFMPWRARRHFADTERCCYFAELWTPAFHGSIRQGLWSGGTVTFAAMQIAYYMGFGKVVLVGVDHKFDAEGAPNEVRVAEGPDTNHFDTGYFGRGVRWNLPDLPTSEQAYRMARAAFEADGRKIVNATRGGALEVFPRTTLAEALGKAASPPRGTP